MIFDALPDAAAAVQAPDVVCGEEVTVRPARPQDTGMIGAYIYVPSISLRAAIGFSAR